MSSSKYRNLHYSIFIGILKVMIKLSLIKHIVGWCLLLGSFIGCQEVEKKPSMHVEPILEQQVSVDFQEIIKRGYFTAIVDNSSTGMFLYKGQPMGFEYELLERFAKAHGLQLKVDATPSVKEGFQKLEEGRGDILAYNLTITKERTKRISFTDYHKLVKLVLIQRKPDNWRKLKLHEINSKLIKDPVSLIDKKVSVRNSTTYVDRLHNLSEEIGADIEIVEEDPSFDTEDLIEMVSKGEIDYTIAEEDIARVNSFYYPNLDVNTAVSFSQRIAWGVRKNSPVLLDTLNNWLREMKKNVDYHVIHNKYFKNRRESVLRAKSDYSSIKGGKLSPYDDLIKKAAEDIGWDWRLLAAQIFKESKFDKNAVSWAGATGLMQLLPSTGEQYGYSDLTNPQTSIKAGIKHIEWISSLWENKIDDSEERKKFILASYNIGQGHIQDAYRLALKYHDDAQKWEVVSKYLLKKSKPKFYNDPVVKYGYCKGIEPVDYVKVIYDLYEKYHVISNDSLENGQRPA